MVYFIATPIGNLEDLSARARRILKDVDAIGAEDTRHTRKLLSHEGISTPLFSFHQHNEKARCEDIIQRVKNGKTIGIVSDAGMPVIADAGRELVVRLQEENLPYTCIPGASAVETALVISGLPNERYSFLGFIPRSGEDRKKTFLELSRTTCTTLFFESPQRLLRTLEECAEIFPHRQISVMRELTKIHEEILTGSAKYVYENYAARQEIKGECVVAIAPAETPKEPNAEELIDMVRTVRATGDVSHRTAVKIVAALTGASRRAIYSLTLDSDE